MHCSESGHRAPPYTSPERAADSAQGKRASASAALGHRQQLRKANPSLRPHSTATSSVRKSLRLASLREPSAFLFSKLMISRGHRLPKWRTLLQCCCTHVSAKRGAGAMVTLSDIIAQNNKILACESSPLFALRNMTTKPSVIKALVQTPRFCCRSSSTA